MQQFQASSCSYIGVPSAIMVSHEVGLGAGIQSLVAPVPVPEIFVQGSDLGLRAGILCLLAPGPGPVPGVFVQGNDLGLRSQCRDSRPAPAPLPPSGPRNFPRHLVTGGRGGGGAEEASSTVMLIARPPL